MACEGKFYVISGIVSSDKWNVAVLQCKADKVRSIILDFYDFVRDIEGVGDLHFLIRDRIEDEVMPVSLQLASNAHIIIGEPSEPFV
jgi:hypothetical protein